MALNCLNSVLLHVLMLPPWQSHMLSSDAPKVWTPTLCRCTKFPGFCLCFLISYEKKNCTCSKTKHGRKMPATKPMNHKNSEWYVSKEVLFRNFLTAGNGTGVCVARACAHAHATRMTPRSATQMTYRHSLKPPSLWCVRNKVHCVIGVLFVTEKNVPPIRVSRFTPFNSVWLVDSQKKNHLISVGLMDAMCQSP